MRVFVFSALIVMMLLGDGCGSPEPPPPPLTGPPLITAVSYSSAGDGITDLDYSGYPNILSTYVGYQYWLFAKLDTGKSPLTWHWDIDGVEVASDTEGSIACTPAAEGNYACQLTVTNKLGSDTYDFAIKAVMPPMPTYYISPSSPYDYYLWTGFPATIRSGDYNLPNKGQFVQNWRWEFGGACNPNTSTAEKPDVTAGQPGIYHARITVSNASGSNAYDFTIMVKELTAPELGPQYQVVPEFLSPFVGYAGGYDYLFWENLGGPASSWSWDFGGAGTPATSTEARPKLKFGAPGIYHGTVTASNAMGSSTAQITFKVLD